MTATPAPDRRAVEEDVTRARIYGLLAGLLAAPPDAATLKNLAALEGDDSQLGQALGALARLAGDTNAGEVAREYHDLFIGVGRGELLPYASYYLTGFLNEKPLAKLRGRMAELGIERDPSVKEPEDHVAALSDMMAGLITGAFDDPVDLAGQKRFFNDHIGAWAPHFFRDLEAAATSRFYAPVGALGRAFLEIEAAAFDMIE